jgi:hypothetical protein
MSTFCRHLTNGLVYNNNTQSFTVSPCCYFNKTDIVQQDLTHYRSQWQKSDLQKNCRICIHAESTGLHSYRQASFEWLDGIGDAIEFLTIAVNKKCNLACVSCDANSSSFWYQENIRNNIPQPKNIQKLHADDRQGEITKNFLSLLASQDLSKLKYIKFGGGEPLMTDTHLQVLKLVTNPENVTLQYTSNFSLMPSDKVFKEWEKFKLVKWVASVDGVGDQFSFLRWPYRWEKLNDFVKTAKHSVPGNIMFGVEHTLNPLNVFYFDRFQTWFDQTIATNKYGDPSDLNLHLCNGNLGIEQTPPALRNIIEDKFGTDHSVVSMLQQNPYQQHTTMVKYLNQLDLLRCQQWRKIFPEVSGYFDV